MGRVREISGGRSEEHIHREAQGISHTESPGDGGNHRQCDFYPFCGIDEHGFCEEHLFGQEAVEQRYTGHGSAGNHGQRRGVRHELEQAAELAYVAGAALVVDDAGCHKQGSFEGGMVENMKHGRDRSQRAIEAQ